MAGRFGEVKFNFMRAVEMFEDLNSIDMDVQAPPSSSDYFKEKQLAEKLNEFLNQLIEDGFFDDCESRDASPSPSDDEEAEDENEDEDGEVDEEPESEREGAASYDSGRSTPRSAGFDYHSDSRSEGSGRYASSGSRGSFSDRFKRYIKRIIPGSRRSK